MKTMRKGSDGVTMRRLGACGLAMGLMLAQAGAAQQASTVGGATGAVDASKFVSTPLSSLLPGAVQARPAAKSAEEDESAKPDKPGHQGIKVHGHWVLQVKNADGTLGERREFENSLTTVGADISGDQILGLLLAGGVAAGDPAVIFSNNVTPLADPTTLCMSGYFFSAGGPACAGLTTTASSFFDTAISNYLAGTSSNVIQTGLTTLLTLAPSVTWVLSGNYAVVTGQTTIGTVQTLMAVCVAAPVANPGFVYNNNQSFTGKLSTRSGNTSPASCNISGESAAVAAGNPALYFSAHAGPLTSTLLSSPLSVSSGQIVQVTVTISFS